MSDNRTPLALFMVLLALAAPARAEDADQLKGPRATNIPLTEEVKGKIDELEADAKAHPDDPLKVAEYGYALVRTGKLPQGMALLAKAGTLAPDEPKVQLLLARGLWKNKDLDQAVDAGLRAGRSPLATPRDASEAYRVAASSRWEQGRLEEAEQLFTEGLKKDPNNAPLLANLGAFMSATKKKAEALNYLALAQQKSNDPRVLANVARLYEAMGRQEEARATWEKVLQIRPDDPDIAFIAASYDFQAGEWNRVLERLDKTLKAKPQDANAHLMYSQALMRLGRYDEARKQANMAEKLGASEGAAQTLEAIKFEEGQKK